MAVLEILMPVAADDMSLAWLPAKLEVTVQLARPTGTGAAYEPLVLTPLVVVTVVPAVLAAPPDPAAYLTQHAKLLSRLAAAVTAQATAAKCSHDIVCCAKRCHKVLRAHKSVQWPAILDELLSAEQYRCAWSTERQLLTVTKHVVFCCDTGACRAAMLDETKRAGGAALQSAAVVRMANLAAGACLACGTLGGGGDDALKTCQGCGGARYCDADCQRRDWRLHKAHCKTQSTTV